MERGLLELLRPEESLRPEVPVYSLVTEDVVNHFDRNPEGGMLPEAPKPPQPIPSKATLAIRGAAALRKTFHFEFTCTLYVPRISYSNR